MDCRSPFPGGCNLGYQKPLGNIVVWCPFLDIITPMRTDKCRNCNSEKPLRDLFHVNQQLHCEPCANQVIGQLQQSKAPLKVARAIDPTLCALCGLDGGSSEFPKAAGAAFCHTCHEKIYNTDFPGWLKAGLAFTLLLLVFALVHGQRYFRAGKNFFHGERLVATHQYAQAIPELKSAVAVAPDCEKCILRLAKAALLDGDTKLAFEALNAHNQGRFEKSDLGDEISGIADRAGKAFELNQTVAKLLDQKDSEKALQTLQNAENLYPEWPGFKEEERGIQAGAAFDKKDYDTFLQLSEAYSKDFPESSEALAGVSSALACKYAVTGEDTYRQRSKEILEKARSLAHSPED